MDALQQEFTNLIAPLSRELLNHALTLTHDRDEADDIVQLTLLAAWRFFHRYKRGTNFAAWIHTILNNQFINCHKQTQRRPEHVSYSGTPGDWPLDELAITETHEEDLGDEISDALDLLTDQQRVVIIAAIIEGAPDYETAEDVGIPTGTVKSILHRSRKKITEHLKDYGAEHGYALDKNGNRIGDSSRIRKYKNRGY